MPGTGKKKIGRPFISYAGHIPHNLSVLEIVDISNKKQRETDRKRNFHRAVYLGPSLPPLLRLRIGRGGLAGHPGLLLPAPVQVTVEGLGPKVPLAVGAPGGVRRRPGLPHRLDEAQMLLLPCGSSRRAGRDERGLFPTDGGDWNGADRGGTGDGGVQVSHSLLGGVKDLPLLRGHLLADVLVAVQGLDGEGPEADRAGQEDLRAGRRLFREGWADGWARGSNS